MPYALGTTYKTYRSGFTSRRRHIDDWISRHFYKFASWLISWSFPRDWRVRVNSRKSTSFIFLGWHAIVITTNTILTVTIITTTNTISQSRCLEWLPRKHRNLLLGICLNCAKVKNENLELLEKVQELEGKLQVTFQWDSLSMITIFSHFLALCFSWSLFELQRLYTAQAELHYTHIDCLRTSCQKLYNSIWNFQVVFFSVPAFLSFSSYSFWNSDIYDII